MSIVNVVAIVVDTRQLTLYTEKGESIKIPQGDHRVAHIVETALPVVQAGGVAEVDLATAEPSPFGEFSQKTNGVVKFFRVAKKALSRFFGEGDENESQAPIGTFGDVPEEDRMVRAVQEILDNAKPIIDTDDKLNADATTVVAVVDNKLIPDVEMIENHVIHSNQTSTLGMQRLMERVAKVIDKRQHSMKDLLRFLERADLPIADDGSIIAYKLLNSTDEKGVFVDCHSKKVKQRVGSYVVMDESLLDLSRRHECGTGLHIARRGYLKSFYGDVCVLIKLAPEDVIAVPHGDPNKVRACGYHIVAQLDDQARDTVKSDRAMTDRPALQKLLGKVIAGDHIGKIEEVRITGAMGAGVIIKSLTGTKEEPSKAPVQAKPAKALPEPEEKRQAAPVDPKKVNETIREQKTKAQQARELYAAGQMSELDAFKKASKKSWETLGFGAGEVTEIKAYLSGQPGTMSKHDQANQEAAVSEMTEVVEQIPETKEPSAPKPAASSPRKEKAAALVRDFLAASSKTEKKAAQALMAHKKASKVSWETLGVDLKIVDAVKKILG